MDCVILAAGKGTRLRPHTDTCPKPLLPVRGRPILDWIIGALDRFGVEAGMREGRVGVWVERKGAGWSREDKIAAIGVKVRKWVSFHGISLNVEPDLEHFGGIVPCGITEHGVTSLVDLGVLATMDEADDALKSSFQRVFGPVQPGVAPV